MVTALGRVRAFVKLGRPLFLGGGFVMYALGAALASSVGAPIDWQQYAWGQLAVTATQLMTHYANDYFDQEADRANTTPTRWSGGSRVLIAGALPPSVALVTALLLAAIALGTVAHFALAMVSPVVAMGLAVMIGLSWGYSAPPLRLHSRGLGELTTATVVTLLVPGLGFVLQTDAPRLLLPLAVAPLCIFQFAMLLAIEFPDAAGDRVTGKRTLVVRWGAGRAARVYVAVIATAYLILPALVAAGLPLRMAVAALAPFPIAAWQIVRITTGAWRNPQRWESVAFWSVALLILTGTAELLAAASL
ncbi:MAG TPA: prenyltransferase [Polyangia bacterium]|jgi:1,4-dihydroxy-2-naphthoate octaprenyltransferase|nr:prenyltransferase [Polyangia bacterium]